MKDLTPESHFSRARYFLPKYQLSEDHEITICAPADNVVSRIAELTVEDDSVIYFLIRLRELPSRIWGKLFNPKKELPPPLALSDFTLIFKSDTEIYFGLAGRFWRPDYGLEQLDDAEAFRQFNKPGSAKLILAFSVESTGIAECILHTHTRAFCLGAVCSRLLKLYWILIQPGSSYIRSRILRLVKKQVEAGNTVHS